MGGTRMGIDKYNSVVNVDLKLHDIPATVSAALRSASKYPVRFVTIHCDNPNLLQNKEFFRK